MGFIYAIREPRDKETFYIGKTKNVERRFKQHLDRTKAPNTDLRIWIYYCEQFPEGAEIRILEECPDSILAQREKGWINFAFSQGWNLANKCESISGIERMYLSNYAYSKIYSRPFENMRYHFLKDMR